MIICDKSVASINWSLYRMLDAPVKVPLCCIRGRRPVRYLSWLRTSRYLYSGKQKFQSNTSLIERALAIIIWYVSLKEHLWNPALFCFDFVWLSRPYDVMKGFATITHVPCITERTSFINNEHFVHHGHTINCIPQSETWVKTRAWKLFSSCGRTWTGVPD